MVLWEWFSHITLPIGHCSDTLLINKSADPKGVTRRVISSVVLLPLLLSSPQGLGNRRFAGGDPPRKCGLAGQGLAWDLAQWPRVCWLSPEPQGTPKPTFLPPNGSPCHHFGYGDRAQAQNCGAVLTRGVPPPQSRLFFDPFLTPKMGKC